MSHQTIIENLSKAGGLFAVLTFIHFLVDWGFQTHDEAMLKGKEKLVRARHCFIYTVGFLPLLILTDVSYSNILICCSILFFSHFFEDTYIPAMWWFSNIRKPPELMLLMKDIEAYLPDKTSDRAFLTYLRNYGPLPYILLITIDQIIHLAFLWPVVYIMMQKQ